MSDGAAGAVGVTVSVAVRVTPPKTAEMVTVVDAVIAVVVMVKLALLEPAGTVTLVGTVVALESSESDTTAPLFGAGALRVTVPVEERPAATLVGLTEAAERDGAGAGRVTVIAEAWKTLSSEAIS
jgi:hypothetical protein